jgi:cobyric acid synthase
MYRSVIQATGKEVLKCRKFSTTERICEYVVLEASRNPALLKPEGGKAQVVAEPSEERL